MSCKIRKSLIKESWKEVEQKIPQPGHPAFDRLLTAAAVEGLAQYRDLIKWFQPPPAGTILKVIKGDVFLSFDADAEFTVTPRTSDEKLEQASKQFDSYPDLRRPLQVLALAALSGNIDWEQEPPFSQSGDSRK